MNNRSPFQVIAILPEGDGDRAERVKQALSKRFDLDLKHYSSEFQKEGVCIQHALTMEDALKTALTVQDLGAGCRILDATGHTVTDSSSSSGADEEPELELDPGRDFSDQQQSTARDLDADDLVMLDGAIGDLPTPELGEADLEGLETDIPHQQIEPLEASFEGTPLEVDDSPPELDSQYQDPGAQEFEELAQEPPAHAPARPTSSAAAGPGGLFKELEASMDAKPADDAGKIPRLAAPSPVSKPSSGGSETTSRSRRPSQAVRTRQSGSARSHSSRMSKPVGRGESVVMFGGWFRTQPRLRILVGFLLALGLGSVAPAVHATGAYTEHFQPLLKELATAKANAKRKQKIITIRSVQDVEGSLSTMRTRYFGYTLGIWAVCFGVLIGLWFRFC